MKGYRLQEGVWRLGAASDAGQLVKVWCAVCPGERHYEPADLRHLLGDIGVHQLRERMSCERCGKLNQLSTTVFVPTAQQRNGITIRRLIGIRIKRVPVWEEVKA